MSNHTYTVQQLARLAGVSVRTLHYYDHIGLLKPSARTAAGYRLYGESDLLRLQQVLFFRELDFPLADIQAILDDPGFDQVKALRDHQQLLQQEAERLERLLNTIEKTISRLTEDQVTPMTPSMTDEELYEGFTPEQIERYTREANELYDPQIVAQANHRVRNMTKAQWQTVKAEGGAVTQQLAELMGKDPGEAAVQAAVARHYAWVDNFWHPTAESYRGLGQGYAEHPEFRAFYGKYRPGLADFMCAAMSYYADHTLME